MAAPTQRVGAVAPRAGSFAGQLPRPSLQPLVEDARLRFLFVGGKGGVGKTTSSAAIATLFAQRYFPPP